ncbi:protein kinase [Actinoplanes sp. NPDC048796]|uniref:protein kinase domain-containing protein n=1 Tax=Actinoplanes sp. NPDC048796 TaxID=3155640 RepID=UPI0033C813AB
MTDFERAHPRQTLADFELAAKLGESPAAEVFRARNRTFGIVVALKRWRQPFAPATRRAFDETCRLHYELSEHPNVVRLLWADLAGDPPWLATELQPWSLADLLRRGPIPPARAWRIAVDVLRALTAVHRRERPHGALKPANVLVTDGRAMLRDLAPTTWSVPDMRAVVALMGVLFPDPPPALRAVLAEPPRTAEAFLAAVEAARGEGREPYVENAGPFRTGSTTQTPPATGDRTGPGTATQNTGTYDRSAEPGQLPANLHTPLPASRRENARTYPEKSGLAAAPENAGLPLRETDSDREAGRGGAQQMPDPQGTVGPAQRRPSGPGDASAQWPSSGPGDAAARGGATASEGAAASRSAPASGGRTVPEDPTAARDVTVPKSRMGSANAAASESAAGIPGAAGFGSGAGSRSAAGFGSAGGSAGSWGGAEVAGEGGQAVRRPEGGRGGRRGLRIVVVVAGALVLAAVVAVVVAYGRRNASLPEPARSMWPAPGLSRS